MSVELTSAGSFAVAAAAAFALSPVAIRVSRQRDFLDHPREYRKHATPTPLLGGATVVAAFLLAALVVAGASDRLLVPIGCAVGLWLLGTIDDRIDVAPRWRVLAEVAAAG